MESEPINVTGRAKLIWAIDRALLYILDRSVGPHNQVPYKSPSCMVCAPEGTGICLPHMAILRSRLSSWKDLSKELERMGVLEKDYIVCSSCSTSGRLSAEKREAVRSVHNLETGRRDDYCMDCWRRACLEGVEYV